MISRKNLKKTSGLRKWNKIVSIIVKDLKKKGESYDIKEVRKFASQVYKDFKDVAPSRLRVGQVKNVANNLGLPIISVPERVEERVKEKDFSEYINDPEFQKFFNNQGEFEHYFQVGDWVNQFKNEFPELGVILDLRTDRKLPNPLYVEGETGNYAGSIFQQWVEDVRETLENPSDYGTEDNAVAGFDARYEIRDGKLIGIWAERGTDLPENLPSPEIIEREQVVIDGEEITTEVEAKEVKKPLPKGKKSKKLPKKPKKVAKKTKKSSKSEISIEIEKRKKIEEYNKAIERLERLLNDKIITKKQFRTALDKLNANLEKGGKI